MENLSVVAVLDSIKTRHDLKSDYALCKLLECSTQLVANWRHGRALPDEKRCQKLADLAGIDADVLIAKMNAQRAKDSAARAIWERIAERLQVAAHGLAAVIFSVVIASGFIADDARAESASSPFVAHVEDFASSIN
jgi:transcriptional regulator with XRE-family HTH domain